MEEYKKCKCIELLKRIEIAPMFTEESDMCGINFTDEWIQIEKDIEQLLNEILWKNHNWFNANMVYYHNDFSFLGPKKINHMIRELTKNKKTKKKEIKKNENQLHEN